MLSAENLERDRLHQLIRRTPAHIAIVELINAARQSGYAEAMKRLQPDMTLFPDTAGASPQSDDSESVDRRRFELVRIILDLAGLDDGRPSQLKPHVTG